MPVYAEFHVEVQIVNPERELQVGAWLYDDYLQYYTNLIQLVWLL